MIDRHFLPLVLGPYGWLRFLCTRRFVCAASSVIAISKYTVSLFDARSASREGALSPPRLQADYTLSFTSRLFSSAVSISAKGQPLLPSSSPAACLVSARSWAVVDLHRARSTTNFHGPPSLPRTPQCSRQLLARKRHPTRRAGSPEQVSSPTCHEQPSPPLPNLPTHPWPQNTSTSPLGVTTRRHMSTTLRILVPVHLGTLNPNHPSRRHQRVHLISSPRPYHQTLPSLCHTPVRYLRSANIRILPFASHPRARTKIGTRTPFEVVNGIGLLILRPRRPLGK